MSVGHGGNNSRHTGLEKLFILEYLEAKFQDASEYLFNTGTKGVGKANIEFQIFDPYNSSHDFFILITPHHENDSFADTFKYYEEIHKLYQTLPDTEPNMSLFTSKWTTFLGSKSAYDNMRIKCLGDPNNYPTLHASSSETTFYFTAEQVAKFYGLENLFPKGTTKFRVTDKPRGRSLNAKAE